MTNESVTPALVGKSALVTGASSGLGAHIAKSLAAAGARVILVARRREALSASAEAIRAAGGTAEIHCLDVTKVSEIETLRESLRDVDILVNNAGVVREGYALSQSEDDWDTVLDTNLKAYFFVAQAAARAMKERKRGGAIINIASILGLRQAAGVLPYAVSKAGVIQLTKVLALELARFDIRVNALAPGYFDTELNHGFWKTNAGAAMLERIPQRRLGHPADLDAPLLMLATSPFVTGAVLTVDGGHTLSSL